MHKPIRISVLGATGSVGSSLMSILEENVDRFIVHSLSANSNYEKLSELANKFKPKKLGISSIYKNQLQGLIFEEPVVLEDDIGLVDLATDEEVDIVFLLVSGTVGLKPLAAALKANKIIGLANKESLVLGGKIITRLASESKGKIIPLDSEHNSFYQCLTGKNIDDVKNFILTASGGPFLNYPQSKFDEITPKDALNHPTWSMGQKISIDSATMMNKCLEIIETYHLFKVPASKIQALVHPQSVVHGMVEFKDGSYISLLASPDMRLPLIYLLNQYQTTESKVKPLDFEKDISLDFRSIDNKKFSTVNLAYKVLNLGEGAPAYLNGVNQRLVENFLSQKIKFNAIFKNLSVAVRQLETFFLNKANAPSCIVNQTTLDDALQADYLGQEFAEKLS